MSTVQTTKHWPTTNLPTSGVVVFRWDVRPKKEERMLQKSNNEKLLQFSVVSNMLLHKSSTMKSAPPCVGIGPKCFVESAASPSPHRRGSVLGIRWAVCYPCFNLPKSRGLNDRLKSPKPQPFAAGLIQIVWPWATNDSRVLNASLLNSHTGLDTLHNPAPCALNPTKRVPLLRVSS